MTTATFAAPIKNAEYLPARMINEAVYCPRLFYLMHVEGLFQRNRFTADGDVVHRRVDARVDPLALIDLVDGQETTDEETDSPEREIDPAAQPVPVHARSVTLASDELGVIAKLDLVEATGNLATPVDYKRGRPRRGVDGQIGAWPPERVQICLQALVLRENGFQCDRGILYFNETRQRVEIEIDDALIQLTRQAVDQARHVRELPMPPPPLVDSPKCPHCSLSSICLPDETNRCSNRNPNRDAATRLPTTARDEQRPLYLTTQGLYVGKKSEVLQVKQEGKLLQEVRLRELNQVNLFGNIQLSTQAIQTLCALEVPMVMFSRRGYFHGMLQGTGLKNILLRREQFRLADDPARCLAIAKLLIEGKIRNCRVLLMRNHISPPTEIISELKRIAARLHNVTRADQLLGVEGTAARLYFGAFSGMLKPGDAPADPDAAIAAPPRWSFDFNGRNRRPPRDAINAMLSLAYSLLAKDLTVVAAAVGLDPYLGFYHLPRPGRPALALDLMEPFRPLIAESVVLSAVNNRMLTPEHFVPGGRGVFLSDSGRKAFFHAYELRMDQLVTHPLFEYRVSYRRLLEIQTRLMAQMVRGEIETFPVFVTR
ncbi:CRISPR-associated protein Cas4/endonuclease Cas1 fusion [Rosistilla ulvae]|uniref:CRISPR-associated endonuclease Cas1 n=1 Tax=Rosistilla ulvae TaxID=1930277 RepID=A0A517LTH3_9BACT|nr:CRISPR-associated endonuclease Cas1 [Rosistilla ulvae]QDS85925.1 CRISPR-associated protein Cas4/endonuclease Cas1 fusion [Rosistilla ulvae]